MKPGSPSANVSVACWRKHGWEGWVADKPRASVNAKLEAYRDLQILHVTALAI